ncbi:MAG: nucleotidyl transferase AbiEii/AbiGii toxin family protein [Candidatus Woesearchaeota archaeon]
MVLKEITQNEFDEIIAVKGFDYDLMAKDYYITIILYLIKDIKGLYFKGGTALQKTVLDYARISEDIDFTLTRDLKAIKKEIIKAIDESKLFGTITKDKDVTKFARLIVPYNTKISKGEVFIDLNERSKLCLKPENKEMKQFYPNIPPFTFSCLFLQEMIAEKVAAAIGRNKPRDHYDVYQIIKHKLPIDLSLVKKKCKQSGIELNILKMFNMAKKLHKRWNNDLIPLLVEEVSFHEVMKTLANHFNLKEEKEKLKDQDH